MLRAGALLMSVTIALVVALLSTFLILLAGHYKQQESDVLVYKKLALNSRSGLNLLLAGVDLPSGTTQTVDLYDTGLDSVRLYRTGWGVYEVLTSTAFSGNKVLTQAALCGHFMPAENRTALYMADMGRPLNLCGNTLIKGTAYLPEAGVRQAFINGSGYQRRELIYGPSKKSKSRLPEFNPKNLATLLDFCFTKSGNFKQIEIKDTLHHSFSDTTVLIQGGQVLRIDNKHWVGNMIIKADSLIVVGANTLLENVILVAATIVFEPRTQARVQAFATDSIILKKECQLIYPSALGVFRRSSRIPQPYIRMEEGSEVRGFVFTKLTEPVFNDLQTKLMVDKKALLTGEAYVEGFAQLNGEVHGSFYCHKFTLRTSSALYENHLLDAVIDAEKLPQAFVGNGLFGENTQKRIIQWLR